jgi:uncharacterized membrane protein YcaP (DUF421 family)
MLESLLGLQLEISDVDAGQMALRTIVVYVFTLAIIRVGSKRFLGRASALDIVVGIMLGSIMSRAINGSAPFVPTLGAGAVLIALHWLLAVIAWHFDWFGPLVKGNAIVLIKDGEVQEQGMRRGGISKGDLTEALRQTAKETDLSKIENAWLERDGQISIIPAKGELRVFEVAVGEGVKTVRVELA